MEDSWKLGIEREMGVLSERQRALESAGNNLRLDVKEGFREHRNLLERSMEAIRDNMTRDHMMMRGEVDRLERLLRDQREADERREADKRTAHEQQLASTIAELKADNIEAHEAKLKADKTARFYLFLLFIVAIALSAGIEHAQNIFSFVSQVLNHAAF